MAEPVTEAQVGWKLVDCKIIMDGGSEIPLTTNLNTFTYYEDLERICPTATAVLNDLGAQDLPLSGGEEFIITLVTDQTSDEEVTHEFIVGSNGTPFIDFKGKYTTLNLIKKDSKVFSTFKAMNTYKGTGDSVLALAFQDAKMEQPVRAMGPAPFNKLLIPGEGISLDKLARRVCTQSIPQAGEGANTCGYFLFGTRDGYNFASIDHLLSTGDDAYNGIKPFWEYYQAPSNTNQVPGHLIIQHYSVKRDGDLKAMADKGVFAAILAVTNTDTQEFKEERWNLQDHWKDWGHIGNQSKFPAWMIKWLDEYQTSTSNNTQAVRTFKIDTTNEAFFNEEETAAETTGRDGGDVETEYPDWGPYTVCQYNARRATMAMNVTNVVVPGNSQLRAGNKIKLHIQSSKPDHAKDDDDEDLRRSGAYLIFRLAHRYTMTPRECFTAATLVKDSMNKNC